KARVFPQTNLPKRVGLPKCSRVTQARAVNPRPMSSRINVFPSFLFFRRIEPDPAQAANVGGCFAKLLDLVAESPWGAPVIVVPMHEHLSARFTAGEVALRANWLAGFGAAVSNARIFRHQITNRIRPIIDDH